MVLGNEVHFVQVPIVYESAYLFSAANKLDHFQQKSKHFKIDSHTLICLDCIGFLLLQLEGISPKVMQSSVYKG